MRCSKLLVPFALLLTMTTACSERDESGVAEATAASEVLERHLAQANAAIERGNLESAKSAILEALESAGADAHRLRPDSGSALFWQVFTYAEHLALPLAPRLRTLERALENREQRWPRTDPELMRTRAALSIARAMLGDLAGSRELAEQSVRDLEGEPERAAVALAMARRDLAQVLHEAGEPERGRSLLDDAVQGLEAAAGDVEPELSVLRLELAIMLELEGAREGACEQFGLALGSSREWLIANGQPGLYEDGESWRWAWLELYIKLDFLEGDDAAEEMGALLQQMLDDQDPASGATWTALREALVAALLVSKPATEVQPGAVVTLADAYASRLRGHTRGWRECGRGGRGLGTLVQTAEIGDTEAVSLLLDRGADPTKACLDVGHWQPGEPGLRVLLALPLAAAGGHAGCVRSLLATGMDPDHHFPGRKTALEEAAGHKGASEVVRLLLEAGADPLGKSEGDWLPLNWAAYSGEYPSFLALLEASRAAGMPEEVEGSLAEVERKHLNENSHWILELLSKDDPGPLQLAARHGSLERLEGLLEDGADPDEAMARSGWRPLHWAAGHEGDVDRLRALLKAGADPNASTTGGYTPLIAAIQADAAERVELLLRSGADPNGRGMRGRSPLHVAARNAGPAVVRHLLSFDADVTYVHESWTPLQVAEHREHGEVVDLLKGASER